MKTYKSLEPRNLPEPIDGQLVTEKPIVEVVEGPGRIVIAYTFPGFYLSDDSRQVDGETLEFSQVNISSTGFLAESGKPLIPSLARYVQIPPNTDYKVAVDKRAPVYFDNILILPAQARLTDSPDQQPAFEYDRQFYESDVVYPTEMVRVDGPFLIDNYTALLLHVTPFQYNSVQRRLTGYGNMTVTIEVMPAVTTALPTAFNDSTANCEAFGNLFVNPGRSIGERLGVDLLQPVIPINPSGPELLIIYHDTFAAAAKQLADWKNMRGLRTELVSINTISNTPAKIKAYIRSNRTLRRRLRYVLLFGDVDMIATEEISNSPWGSNASDYYYSTPSDPSNPTELVMPWLAVGRIPVRSALEGKSVVRQIVEYEKSPPVSSGYYQKMVFAAYFQDDDHNGTTERGYLQAMENIRQQLIGLGFDIGRIYVKTAGAPVPSFYVDGSPVPPDVAAAFVDSATATNQLVAATNEGRLIAAHRDHGLPEGWHMPSFTKNDLNGVTSSTPTLFFSVNCLTGQFDLVAPAESFAEKLLRMNGGAPSLIAATRVSHTWLNDSLMKALFDAMWGGVLPTFPTTTASYPIRYNRLGDVLNYAKSYLPVTMSGSNEYIKDHLEIYHVVGDPSLELWRAKPLRMMMKSWIAQKALHITLSHVPKDTVLTIWNNETLLKRIEPSSTHVELSLPPNEVTEPLKLMVCFWAPGYHFRQLRPLQQPVMGAELPQPMARPSPARSMTLAQSKPVAVSASS